MSIAIETEKPIDINGYLADKKERDLTGEEVEKLLQIFVSEKTCAEREKTILAALETLSLTDIALRNTLEQISVVENDHESRLKIIEENRIEGQRRSSVKIAVAVAITGLLSNLDKISGFLKAVAQ